MEQRRHSIRVTPAGTAAEFFTLGNISLLRADGNAETRSTESEARWMFADPSPTPQWLSGSVSGRPQWPSRCSSWASAASAAPRCTSSECGARRAAHGRGRHGRRWTRWSPDATYRRSPDLAEYRRRRNPPATLIVVWAGIAAACAAIPAQTATTAGLDGREWHVQDRGDEVNRRTTAADPLAVLSGVIVTPSGAGLHLMIGTSFSAAGTSRTARFAAALCRHSTTLFFDIWPIGGVRRD